MKKCSTKASGTKTALKTKTVSKPRKAVAKAPAKTVRVAPKKKPQTVTVTLKTTRWGKDDPTYQNVTLPLGDDEKVTLEVTINMRETDSVEIRPVRRAMTDVKGLIKDAERLANQP